MIDIDAGPGATANVTVSPAVAEPGQVQQGQTNVWRALRAEYSRVAFEAAHPHPFLVRGSGGRLGTRSPIAQALQVSFHTVIQPQRAPLPRPSLSFVGPAGGTPEVEVDTLMVFAIRKAPENPFPDRISLGRALNCDIAIRDGSISKLHGHFREVSGASAVFVDAKSANGTRIDGALLEPGTPCFVNAQSRIAFGRVHLELMSAGQLYDLL